MRIPSPTATAVMTTIEQFFNLLDLPADNENYRPEFQEEALASEYASLLPKELNRLTFDRVNLHIISAVLELLFTLFAPLICMLMALLLGYRLSTHGDSLKRTRRSNKWVITLLLYVVLRYVFVHLGYRPEHVLTPGLYYNENSIEAKKIVDAWDEQSRSYEKFSYNFSLSFSENSANFFNSSPTLLDNGDSLTLIPFVLNKHKEIDYTRRWVKLEDGESVALDCSFPSTGHSFEEPLFLFLHGLNGGSNEEYVKDGVFARNHQGSTVCVMIARGLMGTPVVGENFFHGARVSDVHETAKQLRKAVGKRQKLIGSGFSMGAIILNNYFASYSEGNLFDAAITFSGSLNSLANLNNERSMRLWQPFLADELRNNFLFPFEKKFKLRLTDEEFEKARAARDITTFDRYGIVIFNGYSSIEDYYREMSAAGDWDEIKKSSAKLESISKPLCVVYANDDPIVNNDGLLDPRAIVEANDNMFFLITARGGHVAWPLGTMSSKWMWMSRVMGTFVEAL